MKPRITVGKAIAPDGTRLELIERDDEYVIEADGMPLMSSRMHFSEAELARVVCENLKPKARVMIGGLGLGYTLRSALDLLPKSGTAVQVELIPEIVEWNRGPLGKFADHPLNDPRTKLALDDVTQVIRHARNEFDAIMLDVDNGPEGLARPGNDSLYNKPGLRLLRAALRHGGVLGVWSAADHAAFDARLRRERFKVQLHHVRARRTKGPRRTIWTALAT